MFQNAAIDVAIGLILMYLMLSLLCTVVNEFIATKLKLRSSTLQDGLQKLIDDPTLLNNFYAHGLIASSGQVAATGSQTTLQAAISGSGSVATGAASAVKSVMAKMQGGPAPGAAPASTGPVKMEGEPAQDVVPAATGPVKVTGLENHPSYLAGGTVALALMSSALKQNGTAGATDFADVKSAIDKLHPSKLKDSLQASVLQANQDIDALRQSIATWFDDSMDRLSGAYKRKMKWIAMLIGLVVAIAFNADSFKVATTLWNDADRRASTIAIATEVAKKPLSKPDHDGEQAKKQDVEQVKKDVADTESTLRSLPIGWNCQLKTADGSTDYLTCVKQKLPNLKLLQILGWILTAAALSLGAPFWFDLLNKFINLRGSGAKPVRDDRKTG